jgi:catechol 2,3-dioxygenase-like lactoylglutathione lyase family enzyme
MRIKLTSSFVDDQDRAREFYTDVLGLQVKVDAPYGDNGGPRWLSVVAHEDPYGTELLPDGGTDAVFDDGCGNLICLHQD